MPAGFTKAGAVDDRGTKFSGPSNVTLQAYGSANLLQSSAEQVCREQAEAYTGDGGSATSQFTGDRCTVTGTLQGTTHQIETWVGSATLNHVEVTYPASSAALGQQTFTAAVASFRPGDLATAH